MAAEPNVGTRKTVKLRYHEVEETMEKAYPSRRVSTRFSAPSDILAEGEGREDSADKGYPLY